MWTPFLFFAIRLPIDGLDDCCAPKAVAALAALPALHGVVADPAQGSVCFVYEGDWQQVGPQVEAALAPLEMKAGAPDPAGRCAAAVDPWAAAAGLDFAVVSRGEAVSLKQAAVPGKVTILDFGAQWCAPCHVMAAGLSAALATRPQLAVRAVLLPGDNAVESFASPVSKQHLTYAPGLPFVVVMNPKGRVVYQGSELTEALAAAAKAGAP